MGAYQTVVVGTDGSDTSLRAVTRAQGALGDEACQLTGSTPAENTAGAAADQARTARAGDVKAVAVAGSSVEVLLDVVRREKADLLLVGNRGLNSVKGRLLGSVPADATRRSDVDVQVVHTTG